MLTGLDVLVVSLRAFGFVMTLQGTGIVFWRLGPAIPARDSVALRTFRRSVALEWVLIVIVVTVSALLTALFSPGH